LRSSKARITLVIPHPLSSADLYYPKENTNGLDILEQADVGITTARQIEDHEVPPLELLITRRLSKNLGDYFSKRQLSVNAAIKFVPFNWMRFCS
jgi:hypothetical protein